MKRKQKHNKLSNIKMSAKSTSQTCMHDVAAGFNTYILYIAFC